MASDQTIDRTNLPIRRPPFQGVVKRTLDGSQPDWEHGAPIPTPEGAPNVLLVLTDDAGFGNPSGFGEGVIVAEADHLGGFSLFVQDGKLKHTYSFVGVLEFKQESEAPLPAGSVNVRMEFAADAPEPATGGEVTLYVNDEPVGGGRMEHTVPVRFSG